MLSGLVNLIKVAGEFAGQFVDGGLKVLVRFGGPGFGAADGVSDGFIGGFSIVLGHAGTCEMEVGAGIAGVFFKVDVQFGLGGGDFLLPGDHFDDFLELGIGGSSVGGGKCEEGFDLAVDFGGGFRPDAAEPLEIACGDDDEDQDGGGDADRSRSAIFGAVKHV